MSPALVPCHLRFGWLPSSLCRVRFPSMPHHADRPSKICPVCGRPFQWRKKWKEVWEEVRYCSERCRRQARRPGYRPQP